MEADGPTVISLFAGCGGSSLGYRMAGYRELLAVEWDDNAVATFKLNFPGVPVYHGDIARLSVAECCRLAGVEPGALDVLDGSPPCQGFSTAGKRRMGDGRNHLFREYCRLLQGLQPQAFVMENVSGMVKGKMKLVTAEVFRELIVCGYRVKAQLMNAMYFGVPQSRERMIFVGVRNDLRALPGHPKPQTKPTPFYRQGGIENDDWLTPHEDQSVKRHDARQKALGNGFLTPILREGVPALTLSKTLIRAGSHCCLLINDKGRLRIPSRRESKYIASFPDHFQFVGSRKEEWSRIGNSVPPLFMKAIACHLRFTVLEAL